MGIFRLNQNPRLQPLFFTSWRKVDLVLTRVCTDFCIVFLWHTSTLKPPELFLHLFQPLNFSAFVLYSNLCFGFLLLECKLLESRQSLYPIPGMRYMLNK